VSFKKVTRYLFELVGCEDKRVVKNSKEKFCNFYRRFSMRRVPDPRMQTATTLPEGADVNTILHTAARNDNYDLVIECLERGADATLYKDGYTSIGIAAFSGSVDTIEEFRRFYYRSGRPDILAKLLKQPQGVVTVFGIALPFLCPKFSNFNKIVESSRFYPEESANRDYLEGLLDRALAAETSSAGDAVNFARLAAFQRQRDLDPREERPPVNEEIPPVNIVRRRGPRTDWRATLPEEDPVPPEVNSVIPSRVPTAVGVDPIAPSGIDGHRQ